MTDNIIKIEQLHNERDDTWNDVYEADAVGGGRVRVEVPRDVREPGNVRKHLLRKGADISSLDHSRGNLINAIQIDAPIVRRARSLGWREDGRFVGPYYVVGSGAEAVVPPREARWTAKMQERGTLKEWQALVSCARYSTTMTLCLSAAFAAPFLRLLNCPSFVVALVGPSRCAKSTSQLVGASAYGFGMEEHLPTPKGTAAGLIETAAVFNDHVLLLNELGAAAGDKSEKYSSVLDMTYAFTGGQDATRHSTWTFSIAEDFKVLGLMSSEVSPDEWAARAGTDRDPGEIARMIGAPALYNGQRTVFDSYPVTSIAERRPWIESQLARLRAGLPEQRGVAFRTFMEALTADRATFTANAQEDVAAFREALEKHATSPIARDIIFKFGAIYAGGRAAAEAEVLPIDVKTIWSAIRRACVGALKSLPDPEAELRSDLLTLKGLLASVGVIDADEASTRQKQNMGSADGYYAKDGVGRLYTLRTKPFFMNAFPSLLRGRRVLEWLDGEGHLRHQRGYKNGVSTEWAQTQVKWPNGQRVRSFVLFFPAGLKVLEKA